MTQPQSYVITHKSSPVINDCVQSLEQHSWSYEIFPATDGQTITQRHWNCIGVRMSDAGKMPNRPGAQGCWHSHFTLWQRCVELNKSIIVLEHDAVVTAPWPNDLDLETQLIKLYSTAECKLHPHFGLWSKGSHAYSLTPKQAQTLITDAQKRGAQAVDKHLGDRVLPWTFLSYDLVIRNPRRGRSTTSQIRK